MATRRMLFVWRNLLLTCPIVKLESIIYYRPIILVGGNVECVCECVTNRCSTQESNLRCFSTSVSFTGLVAAVSRHVDATVSRLSAFHRSNPTKKAFAVFYQWTFLALISRELLKQRTHARLLARCQTRRRICQSQVRMRMRSAYLWVRLIKLMQWMMRWANFFVSFLYSLHLFYLTWNKCHWIWFSRCGHGPNHCVLMRALTIFFGSPSCETDTPAVKNCHEFIIGGKCLTAYSAPQPTLHIDCCYPHQSVSRRKIWLISKFKALSFRLCVCYTRTPRMDGHTNGKHFKRIASSIYISVWGQTEIQFFIHSFVSFDFLSFPFPGNRAHPQNMHRRRSGRPKRCCNIRNKRPPHMT